MFKEYNPNQLFLLPPSLEELIPTNHAVRVVQSIIEQIDLEPILKQYKGGGTSSYHPSLLLKVMTYAYLSNIYSSRKIEAAVSQNIHFMWLAAMQQPDHNTINRFRSEKLKGVFKEIFSQVVLLLSEQGLVSLERISVDGTKIEANANRYTFVWGKAIKRHRDRIKEQLEDLWHYAEQIAAEEMKDNEPTTFEQIDAEKVEQTIEQINEVLKDKVVDKKVKQKLNYAKKNWPKNLRKYKDQERIMGDRNSYSRTDPDATFMRMKEDHMRNGQLKPGYNWQISTSDQFIVNYDIYQNCTDTLTLPDHLDQFEKLYDRFPEKLVADAGYGSEQNYEILADKKIKGYVKYNYFHKEQKKKHRQNPFHPDNLYYHEAEDFLVCPMGQKMPFQYHSTRKTKSGFQQKLSIYQARNCDGCPLRGQCHKSKDNRKISLNHILRRHKAIMRKRLLSEEGIKMRKKRPADVEAVFGNVKQNKGFKRFLLRGKQKVLVEVGLISLAQNLAKLAN